MWGLWWTKRQWGRFSPSTSVSHAKHSTNFFIIIINRGWHSRPVGGRSAEWTQLDSTPHYTNRIEWAYEEGICALEKFVYHFIVVVAADLLLFKIPLIHLKVSNYLRIPARHLTYKN
jgi:hypothetical protein